MSCKRALRVAVVQMPTDATNPGENLARAERHVRNAVGQGATLVVLPEYFGCGYSYDLAARETCEPLDGPTGNFLDRMARGCGIWIAGSLYESQRSACFNTFVLSGPNGERFVHHKRVPMLGESFFFERGTDPLVVDTPLGRIALVVCQESIEAPLLREVAAARPDLVLVGYSAPGAGKKLARLIGGPPRDILRRACTRWARTCGAPVAAASVCGTWRSTILARPLMLSLPFYGQSGIYDAQGNALSTLEDEEGIAVASIDCGSSAPADPPPSPEERWVVPLPNLLVGLMNIVSRVGGYSYTAWREAARS